MRKGSHAYEQALDALVGILRDRALQGAEPLQYGQLSKQLQRLGHPVPAHEGPMPHLLEDASARENPDGSLPMLSALVVRQETRMPSAGFFKLARRAPYRRAGDDVELWVDELKALAAHHARR
ncbi:hypothetical protein AQJ66_06190 [Streptomyces bungoensis]|uniref:Uncharacterized protein n=1 Tax=Streptomyces bungoensis TaxID=285568 RepID=A0A101TB58_9ACTN|nr:hypothetical protein [Streptomyces bungoensis]KUN89044.1 hypothetical protein AQJ66_06190 [Streptomyces bungoensis]